MRKRIKEFTKKLFSNPRFKGYLKVLGYILSSGLITVAVRYAGVADLHPETILLMNGVFNLVIYSGKHELDNLRNTSKE